MSLDKGPEVVKEKCLGHGISPTAKTAVILCPDCGHVSPLPPLAVTRYRLSSANDVTNKMHSFAAIVQIGVDLGAAINHKIPSANRLDLVIE